MIVENTDYRYEVMDMKNPYDVKKVKDFLRPLGFDFIPDEIDYTVILINLNDELIATGSLKKNILKFVAVSPKYRDTTAFSFIVKHLSEQVLLKHKTVFVFTKPENVKKFEGIGYTEIASALPTYVLLEFGYETIDNYKAYLKSKKINKANLSVASIVVNCNPFTNGHKYLIEKAASENDVLYLFVVEEDQSVFGFDIRWKLIAEGISHLKNVIMLRGGNYIVSSATFPAYFLKNEKIDLITQKQTELDVTVFTKHIAPVLEIKKRYVGTETYCKTTAEYNKSMKYILSKNNIELIEIPRLAIGSEDNFVSASKIRKAIKENKLDEFLEFLPDSTKKFLLSKDSEKIKNQIKSSSSRH
ncbi:MAG TPA: [citrate (pro-3S)-lyase] ligase [Bacteroidales bacterium]|nr:[citrate (pro-3S)-lyase] ligase [Bacteroidales bacterium]HPS17614.1 [citrate (pro-3S)-lyase] ligase [Bacteroidales bacterium]